LTPQLPKTAAAAKNVTAAENRPQILPLVTIRRKPIIWLADFF